MIAFDSGWLNYQSYAKVTLPPRRVAMHQSLVKAMGTKPVRVSYRSPSNIYPRDC